jgi:hypothetical protein
VELLPLTGNVTVDALFDYKTDRGNILIMKRTDNIQYYLGMTDSGILVVQNEKGNTTFVSAPLNPGPKPLLFVFCATKAGSKSSYLLSLDNGPITRVSSRYCSDKGSLKQALKDGSLAGALRRRHHIKDRELCASRGKLYTMKIKVDSTWSPERSC